MVKLTVWDCMSKVRFLLIRQKGLRGCGFESHQPDTMKNEIQLSAMKSAAKTTRQKWGSGFHSSKKGKRGYTRKTKYGELV